MEGATFQPEDQRLHVCGDHAHVGGLVNDSDRDNLARVLHEPTKQAEWVKSTEVIRMLLESQGQTPNDSQSTPAETSITMLGHLESARVHPNSQKNDGFLSYINAPWIDTLEQLRSFLPEHRSHVNINLLDVPKVAQWVNSHTPSFLCLEGFSTGEPLNWTSEFCLDVINAARERDYAVLYHFCELLAFAGESISRANSYSAAETIQKLILNAFLHLMGSECSQHIEFSSSLRKQELDAEKTTELSLAKVQVLFEKCLASFKRGTVLYIVLDGLHTLTNWLQGVALRQWLHQIASIAHQKHIVTKILYTSSPSAREHFSLFQAWKKENQTSTRIDEESNSDSSEDSSDADRITLEAAQRRPRKALPHQVVTIMEQKDFGATQAQARAWLQTEISPVVHETSRW